MNKKKEVFIGSAKLKIFDQLMCEVAEVVDKYSTYRLARAGNVLFIKPKGKTQK